MYKVAFIDDGIMEGIQEVPEKTKKYKISNGILQKKEESSSVFCLSHGTMCFWVFSKYVSDKDYILYDIQVLNELTSSGNKDDLIKALWFCLDEKVDLINMSLGITHLIDSEGEDVLKELYVKGTIMVAAQNNNNQITYPACSPYVYGVMRDYVGILKKGQFCYIDNEDRKIDIISHCEVSDIESKHGVIMGKQNSFSAPYISALIYNELKKGGDQESIRYFLKKNAILSDIMNQWEYKIKSIPDWQEDISAPIVVIDMKKNISQKYFEELINIFRKEEFHAAGIWFGEKCKKEDPYIFRYYVNEDGVESDIEKVIKWIFNIARPDIIFIGQDFNDEFTLNNIADVILSDGIQNNDKTLYVSEKNSEQISEMIISHFE